MCALTTKANPLSLTYFGNKPFSKHGFLNLYLNEHKGTTPPPVHPSTGPSIHNLSFGTWYQKGFIPFISHSTCRFRPCPVRQWLAVYLGISDWTAESKPVYQSSMTIRDRSMSVRVCAGIDTEI